MSAPSSQRPSGIAKGERLATGEVSLEMREGGAGRLGRGRGTSGVSDGMLGPVGLVTTGGRAGGVGGGTSSTAVCILEEALPFSSIIR